MGMALHNEIGALAQLGERLLCKQDVIGSIPIGSTIFVKGARRAGLGRRADALPNLACCAAPAVPRENFSSRLWRRDGPRAERQLSMKQRTLILPQGSVSDIVKKGYAWLGTVQCAFVRFAAGTTPRQGAGSSLTATLRAGCISMKTGLSKNNAHLPRVNRLVKGRMEHRWALLMRVIK